MDKKYQVFISSTYEDLKAQREAVVKAVLQLGHLPVGMEMFNAGDQTQWETIKSYIDKSDYYIVILAHRYGSKGDDGLSYTEGEYDYAGKQGIPRLGFVIERGATWPADQVEAKAKKKLDAFKSKVGKARVIKFWDTVDKLAYHVSLSLSNEININPRIGWIRANEAVSPQVAEELARLSKVNNELYSQLIEMRRNDKEGLLRSIITNTFITSKTDSSIQIGLQKVFIATCSNQPAPTTGTIVSALDSKLISDDTFYGVIEDALQELQRLGVIAITNWQPEGYGTNTAITRVLARKVWNITERGTQLYAAIQYSNAEDTDTFTASLLTPSQPA